MTAANQPSQDGSTLVRKMTAAAEPTQMPNAGSVTMKAASAVSCKAACSDGSIPPRWMAITGTTLTSLTVMATTPAARKVTGSHGARSSAARSTPLR